MMVVVVNKVLTRPILVPHAFLLHPLHGTYAYLLNSHVQHIAILHQHVSHYAVALLTAYRWKDRHRSLHLDPHCICRGESAHSSPCFILFSVSSISPSLHPFKKKFVQSTLHYRQPFFILYVYLFKITLPSVIEVPLSRMLVLPQLHCALLICHHLPTASVIPRPHDVRIFGISPSRPISRRQDSFRPNR